LTDLPLGRVLSVATERSVSAHPHGWWTASLHLDNTSLGHLRLVSGAFATPDPVAGGPTTGDRVVSVAFGTLGSSGGIAAFSVP
jgi:hypothetical protein